jgi:uncharacterized protein with gpF-like domain
MDIAKRVSRGTMTRGQVEAEFNKLNSRSKNLKYNQIAEGFVKDADKANIEDLRKTLERSFNIDVFGAIKKRSIKKTLDNKIVTNVKLIKSVPETHLGLVRKAIVDNLSGKDQPEGRTLLEQVKHIGKVTNNRARLIARDQTSKLNSSINEARQKSLGITKYIWRTSKDERVVGKPGGLYPEGNSVHGDHWEREGKEFYWSDPPHDGHPGEPIQ